MYHLKHACKREVKWAEVEVEPYDILWSSFVFRVTRTDQVALERAVTCMSTVPQAVKYLLFKSSAWVKEQPPISG